MTCTTPTGLVIITVDNHTNETHCLSLKVKENGHAKAERFHVNRAVGRNRYYRVVDGDTDACAAAREETGAGRGVSITPQAMVHCLGNVSGRSRWFVPSGLGAVGGGVPPQAYMAQRLGALHEE